jgi:surfactin synthase thioesterase subunit
VSLEDLVCEAVAAVASIWPEPNVPVVLVGHSLGGLVAWHVASRLPVDGLVVCGSAPPDALGLGPYPDPDNSTEAYLRQILSAQDVTDSQLREDFVALYAPILDADQRLLNQFAPPADVLECEILALYGERETTPRLAWSDQTKDRALTLTVPGSHFFVLEHPGNVIEAIRKHLRCLVAQPE